MKKFNYQLETVLNHRRLMEEAEQWARDKGCRSVRLRSNVVRAEAHAFYERLGYSVFKTQKNYRKML